MDQHGRNLDAGATPTFSNASSASSGLLPQTRLSLVLCPLSCPPCNAAVLPCPAVTYETRGTERDSQSCGPAPFRYRRVAEPQIGLYFLPFFLFSGLYLSFQILRDLVSTFPHKR